MQPAGTRIEAAQETMEILHDISQLLNTGLTREQLRLVVDLIESGENPEAVAAVVRELRREAANL